MHVAQLVTLATSVCSKRVRGPPEEEVQKRKAEFRKVECLSAFLLVHASSKPQ